jgi:putative transposase
MVEIVHNRNCFYQTAYHVIWCPKDRRDVLVGDVASALGGMLDAICQENSWPVIAKQIEPDYIHLFLTIPPAIAVADAVKILKGTTARKLFVRFPALRRRLRTGHLWSPSYYVDTTGSVSAQTIRNYVERSEHMEKRR